MFCANCGKQYQEGSKFCPSCGASVDSTVSEYQGETSGQSQVSQQAAGPKGYYSEEAKRKFTITAGILGALFFFGQMLLPMVMMFFSMFLGSGMEIKKVSPSRGTYYKGRIVVVESSESTNFNSSQNSSSDKLRFVEPGSKKLSNDDLLELDMASPWILPGDDRLWLISMSDVASYADGKLESTHIDVPFADITRPFMIGDRPAVIKNDSGDLAMMIYYNGEWRMEAEIAIEVSKYDKESIGRYIQAVAIDDEVFVFRARENSVYVHKGLPTKENSKRGWNIVNTFNSNWYATVIDGKPVVFMDVDTPAGKWITGYEYSNDTWNEFFERQIGMVSDFAVYPMEHEDDFVYVSELIGSFKTAIYRNGREISTTKYGGNFPFPGGIGRMMTLIYMPMMILPLLLSIILALMMNGSRVCSYESELGTVPYASLTRRALAQIIDIPFIGGPAILGYYLLFKDFGDMENMGNMFAGMGLVFGGFAWVLLMVVVFSYTEGKWGLTPGKKVMGIKVLGTDLKPCGFGRGFLRNILMFADGFFNWMVGILMVAFTDNWQRLGDMAARTVVVKTGGSLDIKNP